DAVDEQLTERVEATPGQAGGEDDEQGADGGRQGAVIIAGRTPRHVRRPPRALTPWPPLPCVPPPSHPERERGNLAWTHFFVLGGGAPLPFGAGVRGTHGRGDGGEGGWAEAALVEAGLAG